MPVLALVGSALLLFYTAFSLGGVLAGPWSVCALAIAGLSLLSTIAPCGGIRPEPLSVPVRWLGSTLTALALFQLVPLPPALLTWLSPARRGVLNAAAAVVQAPAWSPLHAAPAAGLEAVRDMLCYFLLFLMLRRIAGHWRAHLWRCVLPLVLLGAAEGALGLWQAHGNAAVARGTFHDSDHYAALLEMLLPFPVMWACYLFSRRAATGLSFGGAISIGALLATVVIMLAGVVHSLSRMGFVAALAGLAASGLAALPRQRHRMIVTTAAAALALLLFTFLPGEALIRRYAILSHQNVVDDPRYQIWAGSLNLIRDYPWMGCGLGAYESCALRYKTAVPMLAVRHAHNDYLELAAGLGIPGCALAVSLGFWAAWGALAARRGMWRFPACACFGALIAIGGHSLVDFSLHLPTNALVLAWILGLSSSISLGETHAAPRSFQHAYRAHFSQIVKSPPLTVD